MELPNPLKSNGFFESRPRDSQIASLISAQSSEIESRDSLDRRFDEMHDLLGDTEIKRPENWGGYILKPHTYEFWHGREHRLNDRLQYNLEEGVWSIKRLAP